MAYRSVWILKYVCISYMYMYMYVYEHDSVGRVSMPQKAFSRLGTLRTTLLLFVHLFYWMGASWVSFSSFLSFC